MIIKKCTPPYFPGSPLAIEVVNIRHYAPHRHTDAIEFVYCFSGRLEVTIAHQRLLLLANEMVTIDHDDIHYMTSDQDNMTLIVHIDLKNTSCKWSDIKYIFFSCATILYKPHQEKALELIYDILISSAYIYAAQKEDALKYYKSIGNMLIDILIEKFCWFSVEDLTAEENSKYRDRLNNICTYVQRNYKNKITISQIAREEYIDENYFSQFIKRTSFKSFTFMVNYIRCYEAEKLLLFTNMSIQEISDACGFSSKKYFHKYFRICWNTTPLRHRKHYQKISALPHNIRACPSDELLTAINEHMAERQLQKLLK